MVMAKYLASIILIFSLSLHLDAQVVGDQTALVIIDMQPYFATRNEVHERPENKEKIQAILNKQVELIEVAKEKGKPIVVIEYDCGGCDPTNSLLVSAIGPYQNSTTIKKRADGMFDDPQSDEKLTQFFTEKGVGNLIITGANGGACVLQSISGAIRKKYRVIAVPQGIADFNYSEFIYPYHYPEENKNCSSCLMHELNETEDILNFEYGKDPDLKYEGKQVNQSQHAMPKKSAGATKKKTQKQSASGQ
jgi:nicotinamidase-related amidase